MRVLRQLSRGVLALWALHCAACDSPSPAAPDPRQEQSAPDTLLSAAPPSITNATQARFAFEASEPGCTFACSLDERPFSACASPHEITALSPGAHSFRVRARDAADHVDLWPASHGWFIDLSAPDTTIIDAPERFSADTRATFVLKGSEPGCSFECALDQADFAPCPAMVHLQDLDEAAHRFAARAVDAAGNRDPSPAVYDWSVDLTPPPFTALAINAGAPRSLTRDVRVQLVAAQAVELRVGFEGDLQDAAWQAFRPEINIQLPDRDGDHVVTAQVRDAAGQLSAVREARIALDRSAQPAAFVAPFLVDSLAADPLNGAPMAADRVVVSLQPGAAPSELAARAWRSLGARVVGALPRLRCYLLWLPAAESVEAAMLAARAWPGVEWVEPERVGQAAGALPVLDPGYTTGLQWHLAQAQVDRAWQRLDLYGLPFGSPDVTVALLDTGVDLAHPQLAAALRLGGDAPLPANLLGELGDASYSPWRPQDTHGHGTQIAGLIAAAPDGLGLIGVAGECSLAPIRVARDRWFYGFRVAAGLQRAASLGADVINLSFTLPASRLVERAIWPFAESHNGLGTVLVQAAGNWDVDRGCERAEHAATPGSLSGRVLTVAASDHDNQLSTFSYAGPGADLSAPGGSAGTCAAPAGERDIWSTSLGAGSAPGYGSSYAAAVVSGVAALLLSLDRLGGRARQLSAEQIAHILRSSAADLDGDVPASLLRRVHAGHAVRLASCQVSSSWRDGGDGACVPLGLCSPGYHPGGGAACLPLGRCAWGYHDGGDGRCLARGRCLPGFALIGPRCVASGVDAGFADALVEDAGVVDARSGREDAGVATEDAGAGLRRLVLQPGPETSHDLWTTSVYSFDDVTHFPGGGVDDARLQIGGWDDVYLSLLRFDLSRLPPVASQVHLELYCEGSQGEGTSAVWLERIDAFWDWRSQGSGRDRARLWWADRPPSTPLLNAPLPAPVVGAWYRVDITALYRAWQSGQVANHGLLLRPASTANRWAFFTSGDSTRAPEHRPRLVVSYDPEVQP